jgi:hypothetical protein
MIIRNSMEEAVRSELARSDREGICRCPLCEADALALALTSLPPQYCASRPHRSPSEVHAFDLVPLGVTEAIERVQRNPRHEGGPGEATPLSPRIVNFNLEEGVAALSTVMEESSSPCTCKQCRADTLAIALNRYPSKYGIDVGRAAALPPKERESIRRELARMMNHAARVVAEEPRHDRQGSA